MTRRARHVRLQRKPVDLGAPQPSCVRAALLCVDAASTSGWALYLAGRLHAYGEVDVENPGQRRRVCTDAHTSAHVRELPLVLALEVPWGGFLSAALSLTAAASLWRDTWATLGLRRERVIELTAAQWRKPLFGRQALPRRAARELEAQLALQIACTDGCYRPRHAPGPDAAAAICIGQPLIRASLLAQTVSPN